VSYADEEQARSAIEGMHGKVKKSSVYHLPTICPPAAHIQAYANSLFPLQFLDGRVISVSSSVPGWQSNLCRGCKTKARALRNRAPVPRDVSSCFLHAWETNPASPKNYMNLCEQIQSIAVFL
jgi:hypothetical protein